MNNQEKLYQVFASILQVDFATLSEESSPDSIRNWDSLAIVNLTIEIEQTFDVQFDILEIADFRNIGIIKSILAEKGVVF